MENAVTPYEAAVLVLGFLRENGYAKTAASFQREAKAHFKGAKGASAAPPSGLRSLLELLNDYVRLKEADTRRLALAGRNPLAVRILEALDGEAGHQAAAVDAAAAAQAVEQQEAVAAHRAQAALGVPQEQHPAPLQQHHQQQLPALQPDCGGAALAAAPAPAGQQQATTPGRQRKGAPRKRRRGRASPERQPAFLGEAAMAEADHAFMAGWGSPGDLLNLPLDVEGLEALLDDGPLQLRFAENLALHINTNLGASAPAHRPGLPVAGAAAAHLLAGPSPAADVSPAGPGGFVAELLADPQLVLAELPADPVMAEVLQAVVCASPPPPWSASRPGSAGGRRSRESGQQQQQRQAGRSSQQQQQQRGQLEVVLPIVSSAAEQLQALQWDQSPAAAAQRHSTAANHAEAPTQEPQAEQQQQQLHPGAQPPFAVTSDATQCRQLAEDGIQPPPSEPGTQEQLPMPTASQEAAAVLRPRSQQLRMTTLGKPAKSSQAASPAPQAAASIAVQSGNSNAGDAAAAAAAAAAQRLRAAVAGLGVLEFPASEQQLLQDMEELF